MHTQYTISINKIRKKEKINWKKTPCQLLMTLKYRSVNLSRFFELFHWLRWWSVYFRCLACERYARHDVLNKIERNEKKSKITKNKILYGKWNIQIIETIDSRPATTDSQHQNITTKTEERIKNAFLVKRAHFVRVW